MRPPERETPRQGRILEALQGHPRVAFAVRKNTGGAYLGDPPRFVRFGEEGDADITGMLVGGRRLEVEVKVPGEWPTDETFERWERGEGLNGRPFKLTDDKRRKLAQRAYLRQVNDGGGLGFVAYDVDDVYRVLGRLEEAVAELRETLSTQCVDSAAGDRAYRQALLAAHQARGRRGRPRGRWQELPAGLRGRDQGGST